MLDQASKDAEQDNIKHSLIWGKFMSSTLDSIYIHEKGLLRKITFHQKYRGQSHDETDIRHI